MDFDDLLDNSDRSSKHTVMYYKQAPNNRQSNYILQSQSRLIFISASMLQAEIVQQCGVILVFRHPSVKSIFYETVAPIWF